MFVLKSRMGLVVAWSAVMTLASIGCGTDKSAGGTEGADSVSGSTDTAVGSDDVDKADTASATDAALGSETVSGTDAATGAETSGTDSDAAVGSDAVAGSDGSGDPDAAVTPDATGGEDASSADGGAIGPDGGTVGPDAGGGPDGGTVGPDADGGPDGGSTGAPYDAAKVKACLATPCAAQISACQADPECAAILACQDACTTEACFAACDVAASPNALTLETKVVACGANLDCYGKGPGLACQFNACQLQTLACKSDAGCGKILKCLQACAPGDGACSSSCLQAAQSNAYNTLIQLNNCAVQNCDPSGAGSCSGRCGVTSVGANCQCDPACQANGNCCSDYKTVCDAPCAAATDCEDYDLCTTDTCDGVVGSKFCKHAGCDDGNSCTDDACTPNGCTHTFATYSSVCTNKLICVTVADCDDGDACTTDGCAVPENSWYATKYCTHAGLCDDGNPCTLDTCSAGTCGHTNVAASTKCDDANNCTTNDACSAGKCVGLADLMANGNGCQDDGNSCTTDVCASGVCAHPVKTGPCDDDITCTSQDTCVGSVCVGKPDSTTNGYNCKSDGNACTDDVCASGKCIHPNNSGGCNDGNPCTQSDSCLDGACNGTQLADYTTTYSCDDSENCTVDFCAQGKCQHKDFADGTVCNGNNDSCLATVCSAGKCTGSVPDGAPCATGYGKGTCLNASCNGAPGTSSSCGYIGCGNTTYYGDCSSACTASGTCPPDFAKVCKPCGKDADCDDGNACTTNTCNKGLCLNSSACDDQNPCTGWSGCAADGTCTGRNYTQINNINDNNPCTVGEQCWGAVEYGSQIDCNDNNPCTLDVCDPVKLCQNYVLFDGSCDDGQACTTGDHCDGGYCLPAASTCACAQAADCDDQNACTVDACTAKTCQHTLYDCADADGCTIEICVSQTNGGSKANTINGCLPGAKCTSQTCDCYDAIVAQDPVCKGSVWDDLCASECASWGSKCAVLDPGTEGVLTAQCLSFADSNGKPANSSCTLDNCNDGVPTCVAGKEICGGPGTPKSCDDGNPCTADACDPKVGCTHQGTVTGPCNDGKACTSGEQCQNGVCTAATSTCACKTAADCDDGTACTVDSCEPKGCAHTVVSCDDGNSCTADTCTTTAGSLTYTCVNNNNDALTPAIATCEYDECSSGTAVCSGGAVKCTAPQPDPNKDGKACGYDLGVCSSGICFINTPPTVESAGFANMPTKPGVSGKLTVVTADVNTTASLTDIAGVTVDASAVGDSSTLKLTASGDGKTFTGNVSTAGLAAGVYLLPVTVTDKSGATGHGVAPLYIYTGTLIHVGPTRTYTTFKAGIAAAVDGDAVVVDASATAYSGSNNKNLLLNGKKILVMGAGAPSDVVLDCGGAQKAFNFQNSGESAQTVLANFTVQNCSAGAIRLDGTTKPTGLTLVGVRFLNNTNAAPGGAVSLTGAGAELTVALSTFTGNDAGTFRGGAIYLGADAKLTVLNSEFSGNTSENGNAIGSNNSETATLLVKDSWFHDDAKAWTILNNSASSSATISGCRFDGLDGAAELHGTLSVTATRVTTSDWGFNLVGSDTITVTDVTFDKCAMTSSYARLLSISGDVVTTVKNVVFTNNTLSEYNERLLEMSYDAGGCPKASSVEKLTVIGNQALAGSYNPMVHIYGYGQPASFKNIRIENNSSLTDRILWLDYTRSTYSDVVIRNNTAKYAPVAVTTNYSDDYNNCASGQSTLDNWAVDGNSAGDAGALFLDNSRTRIVNSVIHDNVASTNGGAIWLNASATNSTTPNDYALRLENTAIYKNTASGNGGAIYVDMNYANATNKHGLDIRYCTIADNKAAAGGGIYFNRAGADLFGSIVWGNKATDLSGVLGNQLYVNSNTGEISVQIALCDIANGNNDVLDDASKVNDGNPFSGGLNGNLEDDPQFVVGNYAAYYLSQVLAGGAKDSPCVDPGAADGGQPVSSTPYATLTTRADGAVDTGTIDLGVHWKP